MVFRANAFAIFLKSQRKWTSPDLTPISISTFKARMQEFGYSNGAVLPHGSYLINLGNPDEHVPLIYARSDNDLTTGRSGKSHMTAF
jgi:endonuclease IV